MPGPHRTNRPEAQGPTPKQLQYPRRLANTRGQTFTYSRMRAEASAEIRRLQAATEGHRLEREVERDRLAREVALHPDGTEIHDDEISGHGAQAQWTHHPDQRPETTARAQHELARYQLPDGSTRSLVAQRIDGRVAITDLPTSGHGRVNLVERHIASRAEMDALVSAYIQDSERRDEPAVLVPADPELTDAR